MKMRKYIMVGVVAALATGYSATSLAASGNIGSGALGTDNVGIFFVFGSDPKLQKSSGGLAETLAEAFDLGVPPGTDEDKTEEKKKKRNDE
jgi:hypothetical protein